MKVKYGLASFFIIFDQLEGFDGTVENIESKYECKRILTSDVTILVQSNIISF